MARPRSFDENEVLDRVTRTFWERGYANTSIADLEAASGLGRQSLYSAFGDKHALFLRALDRYGSRVAGTVSFCDSKQAVKDQLRDILFSSVDFFTGGDAPGPCLVVQALLEFDDQAPDVMARCRGNTAQLSDAVLALFHTAAARGELATGVDPESATTALMAQYFAIPVMARSGATADQLKRGIALLLDQFTVSRPPASH